MTGFGGTRPGTGYEDKVFVMILPEMQLQKRYSESKKAYDAALKKPKLLLDHLCQKQ